MSATVVDGREEGGKRDRSWKPGSRMPMAIEKDFTDTSFTWAEAEASPLFVVGMVCTYSQ